MYVSAVIDGGSHPFPFRTRKLSLLSPMVLGLRARESRSLQDSRPTCCKQRVGLFLYPLHFVTLSRPQPVDTGCLSLTAPCPQGGGPLRFYRPFRLAASLPPKGGHVHIGAEAPSGQRSPPRQVDTCRLRLTPLAVNSEWGFFYARVVMPAKAGTSLPDPTRDGTPPTHEGVASDSVRARGRPTPHTKILSFQSSVSSPQHIIWPQGRDYKNSQLITNPASYFLTQADPRLREDDVSRASFPSP